MMSDSSHTSGAAALAPLLFTFRWDAAEHRRILRDISRHRERTTGQRIFWWALGVLLCVVGVSVVVDAVKRADEGLSATMLPWLVIIGFWIAFWHWTTPWLNTWQFRRQFAWVKEPARFRFDADGLHTAWGSQASSMRWDGVRRVVETETVFLFFFSPACALFLPTRAVNSAAEREALRRLIRREKGAAAELREG
jgi:hypothetical protein